MGLSSPVDRISLSASERSGMKDFWEVYERHYEHVREQLLASLGADEQVGPVLATMSKDQMQEQSRLSRELGRRAIVEDDWRPYVENLRAQGSRYARAGLTFAGWFRVVGLFRPYLLPHLIEAYGQTQRLLPALLGMERFIDVSLSAIGEAYLAAKEETIQAQQIAIRELSTPVLQLRDGLLILPAVGVVDSERARQLTQQLLAAIRENRARLAVIDVTGVPEVDSQVANHLLQTVEACRLMGAAVIVTGLSAEVAQTLVSLGVDLSKLNTVGDLQGGIEQAERALGYEAVRPPSPR